MPSPRHGPSSPCLSFPGRQGSGPAGATHPWAAPSPRDPAGSLGSHKSLHVPSLRCASVSLAIFVCLGVPEQRGWGLRFSLHVEPLPWDLSPAAGLGLGLGSCCPPPGPGSFSSP